MIYSLRKWVVCLLPVLFIALTSCSDSREKIMEDRTELYIECYDLLESYETGEVSEEETEEGLRNLKEQWLDLDRRMEAFMKESEPYSTIDTTDEEIMRANTMAKEMNRVNDIIERLKVSGRWTVTLERALKRR